MGVLEVTLSGALMTTWISDISPRVIPRELALNTNYHSGPIMNLCVTPKLGDMHGPQRVSSSHWGPWLFRRTPAWQASQISDNAPPGIGGRPTESTAVSM